MVGVSRWVKDQGGKSVVGGSSGGGRGGGGLGGGGGGGGEEVSEMCEEDKNTKVQTFHYKMNKSWGCNIHRGDYS